MINMAYGSNINMSFISNIFAEVEFLVEKEIVFKIKLHCIKDRVSFVEKNFKTS